MTQHEENCFIEAGLKSDCADLSRYEIDGIIQYGRLLTKDLVQAGRDARCENFDLKLENNALRVMNDALKEQNKELMDKLKKTQP
jgi:hypothetical protein